MARSGRGSAHGMAFVEPVTLRRHARRCSSRSRASTRPGLKAAAADGELWRLWYTSVPAPDKTLAWIDAALDMRAKLGAMPFVVREPATGDIVGSTRYFNVDAAAPAARDRPHVVREARAAHGAQHRSEAPAARRTRSRRSTASPSSSARASSTSPSREAIARLGAKQDGILRNHQLLPDGSLRDTVVFSIIAPEWPAVKKNLDWRLTRPRSVRRATVADADRLLPASQGRAPAGVHARVPDAARGARGARRVAVDRRLLPSRARHADQGRGAVRPLRPRVRHLLQGRGRDLRHPRRDSGGVAAQGVRAAALARGQGEDRGAGRLGQADGDA